MDKYPHSHEVAHGIDSNHDVGRGSLFEIDIKSKRCGVSRRQMTLRKK
jgi:hypothetical protein